MENLNVSPSEFLYRMALNQELTITPKSAWSCQATLAVPPFPYPILSSPPEFHELSGLNENNGRHVWLRDVMERDGKLVSRPFSGGVLAVSGRGSYPREARRRVYRTLSNLSIHNMMYRTDIGLETVEKCRALNKLGWTDFKEEELMEPFKTRVAA